MACRPEPTAMEFIDLDEEMTTHPEDVHWVFGEPIDIRDDPADTLQAVIFPPALYGYPILVDQGLGLAEDTSDGE